MGWVELFDLQEVLPWKDENTQFLKKVPNKKSILHQKRKYWDKISFEDIEGEWSRYQEDKERSWDLECGDKEKPGSFLQPIFKGAAWREDKLVGIR